MADERNKAETSQREAMDIIKRSGVLSRDITLERIMDVTSELSELEGVQLRETTFIYKHFIYTEKAD